MRITFLTPLLLFLLSFTSNPLSKKEVLYKCKKGTLSIDKDFIKVDFDLDYYRRGEGDYVEILVLLDRKNYLGSVDEPEYNMNKIFLIEKYQKELMNKFDSYDYSQKLLRVEKKNRRCYFFYYEKLVKIDIGRKMSDGRYCVGANNIDFQVKEKNIIVNLYINGFYKYGEKIIRDKDNNVTLRNDFTSEHRKTSI
jgi:hypothetical protein